MPLRTSLILAACFLVAPRAALAQIDNTSWGLVAGFSPRWQVPAVVEGRFETSDLHIAGHEFRIGVVRGTTFGSEWGVSLVHKRVNTASTVTVDGSSGVARFVTEDAEMLGVEVQRFMPFASVGRRAQVGVNLAGGFGQLRGFVQGEYQPRSPGAQSATALVPTRDIFEYAGRDIRWLPLAKAELGVTALVGDRLKVRVSSGLNLPGFQVVNMSFSYLLGEDR